MDNNETEKRDEELTEEERREQAEREEQEAEAGFAAGFNRVAGTDEGDDDDDQAGEGEKKDDDTPTSAGAAADDDSAAAHAGDKDDDAAAAAAAAAPAKDPWEGVPPIVRQQLEELGKLPGQIRNLAGNIGGLKSQLDTAIATAKAAAQDKGGAGAAPTDTQVKAAMADPKAWEKLKEDFPDWAGPVEAEFAALRAELAKKGEAKPVDVDALKSSLKEELKAEVRTELAVEVVEEVHTGWQETVRKPEFATWLKTQPDDVKALAGSPRAKDAIKLLDTYKEHQDQAAKAAQEKQRREKRLAAGVSPQGTSGPPESGLSDEAAFERGFKKVAKQKVA